MDVVGFSAQLLLDKPARASSVSDTGGGLAHASDTTLGTLLSAASAALRAVVGCAKTYVILFAEREASVEARL